MKVLAKTLPVSEEAALKSESVPEEYITAISRSVRSLVYWGAMIEVQ